MPQILRKINGEGRANIDRLVFRLGHADDDVECDCVSLTCSCALYGKGGFDSASGLV